MDSSKSENRTFRCITGINKYGYSNGEIVVLRLRQLWNEVRTEVITTGESLNFEDFQRIFHFFIKMLASLYTGNIFFFVDGSESVESYLRILIEIIRHKKPSFFFSSST